MNPRAKFGGGKVSKVKKYSGMEDSHVEADSVEDKRAARNARIAEYNATPKAQEAKRKAESEIRKLNIPGPDYKAKPSPSVIPKSTSREADENEANVPDWVLEESKKMLAAARAEKAKERAARNKEQNDWGKEQVDRQKRREEVLAGKPRDSVSDKVLARIAKGFGNEKRAKEYVGAHIPDAPAPLSEGNIEKELKFNPGSKDEMTADEARVKADYLHDRFNYKKGGSVKKNWIKDAIKKPGALRQSLHVKAGEKIPAKKLAAAAKKPGKMGQRARLAQTLKGFSKGGGIESRGKTRCKMV